LQAASLTALAREALAGRCDPFRDLDRRIGIVDKKIDAVFSNNGTRRPSLTVLNVIDTVLVMTANSRMASAVHIMSFVAYAGDEGTTSEAIAKSLQTNPVVVRKILKLLEQEGLVALRQGRQGGVGLRRPASRITLGQIYKAVESETGVFAMRSQVHEGCVVACAMKRRLGPIFNAANDAVEQALSKTSLAELVRGVR
jgi:Rrf2 family protein